MQRYRRQNTKREASSILSTIKTGIAALALFALTTAASAEELQRITIGLASGSLPSAAPRIAQQMGLFEKHGLDPKITQMDDSSVATMALISGSIDFSVTAPSDVIISQARGQQLVAVATIYGGYSPVLVLSKSVAEQTGVSPTAPVIDRLRALNGLLIASTSAISNFTLGLKCATGTAGSTVRLTYMSQPAMVAALETGAVQGFMNAAPYYAVSALKGTGVIWVSGPRGEFPPGCATTYAATLNTSRRYAEVNPEVIRRVKAVFAEFADSVRHRPEDVKSAIAALFPDMSRSTIDLVFESEASGYAAAPPTAEGIAREIAFVRMGGVTIPGLDRLDPARLIIP